MNLNCFTFNQYRFESLDAEAVQGWCSVKQDGVLAAILEHIPNLDRRRSTILGRFDVWCKVHIVKTFHDKWFEQLQRHQLGKTALMEFQGGPTTMTDRPE